MSYAIDQIKSRISLSSVVSKKVTLKRRTAGEFIGLCPFHSEKSPSFNVSDNKGFYHCFGCGAHGDIFSYLMQTEYVDFKEALEKLATEAGVELPKTSPMQKKQQDERDILIAIHETATSYYTKKLFSQEGKHALEYFKKRGLKNEIIAEYGLGYAPLHYEELYNLLKKNFDDQHIFASRVLSRGDYGVYNALKNRIIFPIFNIKGQTIAFGGRILDKGEPKYLNSPETLIFKKSETLYALNFAKKEALKRMQIIVVEGYMDVLSLANSGVYNVVAPLGTGISAEHIKNLWTIVQNPTICLDADMAGKTATARLATEILPFISAEKTLNFANLQGGKDPDEIIMNKGIEYLKSIIDNPVALSELLFQSAFKAENLKTPEGITSLKKYLESLANNITDKDLKKSYAGYFKNKLYELLSNKRKSKTGDQGSSTSKYNVTTLKPSKENNILAVFCAIINHPQLIYDEEISHELHEIEIKSNFLDKIRGYILSLKDYGNHANAPCARQLRQTLEETFNLKLNDGMFDPFASHEDAKEGIIRVFKLNNLIIIREQINQTSRLLMEKQDEDTYDKLNYLKQIEEKLKTELNLIN